MTNLRGVCFTVAAILLAGLVATSRAQDSPRRTQTARANSGAASPLDGIYRIDIGASDKLYSVVEAASSNLPFGEQQRFFIDLAVRLTPPDLLAIERRGRNVSIGSSRAPRITLEADGVTRAERSSDGRVVRSRVALEGEKLVFTSEGRAEDNFNVIFAPIDGGRRLRVTRRITAAQLNEPVIIQTVYNKISETPRWDIYGESLLAKEGSGGKPSVVATPSAATPGQVKVSANEAGEAEQLRAALREWIEATNAREIEMQMTFYAPQLRAYYLTRNVPRSFVRKDKTRAFASANAIDIRAAEPEIIFQDGGSTSIMRFRKQYSIEQGRRRRAGEVVQELRWQRTGEGWKIISERDIRVIR